MKKLVKIIGIFVFLVLIITGFTMYRAKVNYVSPSLIESYNKHRDIIVSAFRENNYDNVITEIRSFEKSISLDNLSENDKEYIECILNTDKLYDDILINLLTKDFSKADKLLFQVDIDMFQTEGQKLIEKRNIYKIKDYNTNFNDKLIMTTLKYE